MNLSEVKSKFPDYLEKHPPAGLKAETNGYKCVCPFHDDHSPSCNIDDKSGTWLFKCWSCGAAGSLIDWHCRLAGLDPGSREGLKSTAESTGLSLSSEPLTKAQKKTYAQRKANPKPIVHKPTKPKNPCPDNFDEIHRIARRAVYENPEIQQKLADEFGVSTDTIRKLCYTSDALGWSGKLNRILYLYPEGAKQRNPKGRPPRFQWPCGRAELPWRMHFFTHRKNVSTVYLTEGESDAIAMIDAGLENLFPDDGELGSCVIASPGTSFKKEWGVLFKGADLIICFDHDDAGIKASSKVAAICSPFTQTIKML